MSRSKSSARSRARKRTRHLKRVARAAFIHAKTTPTVSRAPTAEEYDRYTIIQYSGWSQRNII